MKVVIDTSVWISALIQKNSKAREVLRLALQGIIAPQMSDTLFCEYEAVMKRKKIQSLTPLSIEEQETLFDAYLTTCVWNEIYYSWRPNLKDEDDNFIVELAVASGAKYILTYNLKDFSESELSFNFKVTTPETYIKEFL